MFPFDVRRNLPTDRGLAAFAFLVGVSLPTIRAMPDVTEDWTTTLKIGSSHLWGAMIGVDDSDDLYVTGSNPYSTIVTAKLDSSGSVLWQVEFDNPGTREQGRWLAIDPSGNALVAGCLVSGSSQSPSGFVTLKYDPSGNLLWADIIPNAWSVASRIASDSAGNAIVFGTAWLTNSSGNTTVDMVTVKYAPDGRKLWTRTTGVSSTSVDSAGSLAVDAAGNVFVTGGTIGTILTEAYDPNGKLLWSRQNASVGAGVDIALGPAGEVYVTTSGASQVLVVKRDASGTLQWSNGYTGIAGLRLGVDSSGQVIVAGYTSRGASYINWITHKIAPDGALLWSAIYDRHQYNDEFPYGVLIGPDDQIYVTGQGGPGPTSGNLSYLKTVTLRYSKDGREDWSAANDLSLRGLGVVRLSNHSIATVGESTFTIFHYTQTGIFASLDGALAGGAGLPRLQGAGNPVGGQPIRLDLSRALPNAPAWLVGGFTQINLPFKGGVLVPAPAFILSGLTVSASGSISLPGTWPVGLPSGFETVFQFWIADPAGPVGMAASNGLLAVSE